MPYPKVWANAPSPISLADLDTAFVNTAFGVFTGNAAQYEQGTIGQAIANLIATGATPASINALITASLQNYTPIVNQLETKTGVLAPSHVGPFTINGIVYADLPSVVNFLATQGVSGGSCAPVANIAPSVSFPNGANGGVQATITQGTYNGAQQPTARSWNVLVKGNVALTTTNPSFVIPQSAATGQPALAITEYFTWSGGPTNPTLVGLTSITYTINAPVGNVAPTIISKPTISVDSANTIASVNPHGLYSGANLTLGYAERWADGNNVTLAANAATFNYAGRAGTQLFVYEKAFNGSTGNSIASIENASTVFNIPGGVPPTYDDPNATPPGWIAGPYFAGQVMTMDFGSAINNPTGYDVQLYQGGVAIAGTGATNVTSYNYTSPASFANTVVSADVTPRNAAGAGSAYNVAGVEIGDPISGSSSAIVYVNSGALGSPNTQNNLSLPIPSGAIANDYGIIFAGLNSGVGLQFNTPSGWSNLGGLLSISTPEGQTDQGFVKVIAANEASPVQMTANGNEWKEGLIAIYRGATRTVAHVEATNNGNNTSPFAITFNSMTPDAANQKLVLMAQFDVFDGAAQAVTFTNLPAGFTVRQSVGWASSNYQVMAIIDTDLAANAPTGNISLGISTDSSKTGWCTRGAILGV